MTTIRTTAELQTAGYSPSELGRMVRRSELVRIRRGAYTEAGPDLDAEAQHRQLVQATLGEVADDAVVSHRSAAVLHGLPLLSPPPERVELTRPSAAGGRNRGLVHLRTAPLMEAEITDVNGLLVTSLARTLLDLARTVPFEEAVVAGDAALRAGLDPQTVEESLGWAARRPGIAAARRLAGFVDGRAESAGESVSRVVLHRDGLPKPELQLEVFDDLGRLVARSDFGWSKYKTVGEFDGKIKYEKLLRPGETMRDVIWREKQREDMLRDLGWQVVRWLWADLYRPGVIDDRLRRAFARSGHADTPL